MTENDIGTAIIASAMRVHSAVGPGLLESAYETCLLYELEKQHLPVRRQVMIPIRYPDLTIDNGYRVDLLVADRAVVDLKAAPTILPLPRPQPLTPPKLADFNPRYPLTFHLPPT